ncbi:Uncharacterised protein [uncultured Ruminococcus sp.]|nr:Uncharacterised protein [uncultured Ruminococcus sp.]
MLLNRFVHPLQAFGDNRTGHGQVQADKALGVADEQAVAAFEEDARFVGKEIGDVFHVAEVGTHVHPGQVRRVGNFKGNLRQVLRYVVLDELEVAVQICPELVEPVAAREVGRLVGFEGQGIDESHSLVAGRKMAPQLGVADDDVREHEAGHVEGLACRHACHELGIIRHDFAHRRVGLAAAQEIAVNFVADNPEVILFYDGRDAPELLFRPDAARRVVRIAPDDQLHVRVGGLRLEVVEVDGKFARIVHQGRAYVSPIGVFGGVLEKAVRRRYHEDFFRVLDEVFDELVQGRNDARRKDELFLGEGPAVHLLAPAGKDVVVGVVAQQGIAENAAVDAVFHGLADFRRRGEFHVGHPHADEFVVSKGKFLLRSGVENIAAEAVRIEGVRMAAVDDFIKIVSHGSHLLHQYAFRYVHSIPKKTSLVKAGPFSRNETIFLNLFPYSRKSPIFSLYYVYNLVFPIPERFIRNR